MKNNKQAQAILRCLATMGEALEGHSQLGRPTAGKDDWESPPTKLFWKVQAAFRRFDEATNAIMPLFDEHGLSADAKQLFRLSKTMSITPPRNIDDEFIDAQAALQNLFRRVATAESQSTGGGGLDRKKKISKEAMAMAALADNSDWTDKQIAAHVGCNVKSLYRMKKFTIARAAMKAGRNHIPRGSKSAETGDIEAWDE